MPQPLFNVYVWNVPMPEEEFRPESHIFKFLEQPEARKKLNTYLARKNWSGFMILSTMDENDNDLYFMEDTDDAI